MYVSHQPLPHELPAGCFCWTNLITQHRITVAPESILMWQYGGNAGVRLRSKTKLIQAGHTKLVDPASFSIPFVTEALLNFEPYAINCIMNTILKFVYVVEG